MFKTSAVSHILGAIALATILVGSTAGYLILQPLGNEPIGSGEGWFTVTTLTANYFSHTTSTTKSENPATIYVGGYVNPSDYRSCYRFDLTSLPASSTVTQVRLKLKITTGGGAFANWDIHAYNSNGQTNPSADTGATQWSRDASGNLYVANSWEWYSTGETWITLGGASNTDVQNAKAAGTIFVVSVHAVSPGAGNESPSADGVTTKPQLEITYTPGWSYRKSHVINGATGAGTNYQVKIVVWRSTGTDSGENVYVGTKCRTDFGDVRFTASGGATLLDYWMESSDSSKATFWVEVAGDLSTAQTIYVYYGNSGATTTSNGTNTFLVFDDFQAAGTIGTKLAETRAAEVWYDGNRQDVTVGSTSNQSGGGRTGVLDVKELRHALGQTTYYVGGCSDISYISGLGVQVAVDFDYYLYKLEVHGNYWVVAAFVVFQLSDGTYKMVRLKDSYTVQWRFNDIAIASATGVAITQANTAVLTGDAISTWYSKDIKSPTYSALTVTKVFIGVFGGYDNNVGYGCIEAYFDTVRIRKCLSTEPSHGDWGNEEIPNSPPYAPTPSSPAVGYHFNPSTSVTFSWAFSDPDAGDYQTAYQFQLDDNSDFSSPITNPGKVSSTSPQTTQTLQSTVGIYYWHVKTWDSQDVEGPYCAGITIIVDRIKVAVMGAPRSPAAWCSTRA